MFTIIKNFFHLIKNIINGDEYISDRAKVTYTLTFLSIMHLFYALFFLSTGTFSLIFYNMIAFMIMQFLIRIAHQKHLFVAMTVACFEILIFSFISTFILGDNLNFNLFCFSIIPPVFYISSTVKDFKKHAWFSVIFSSLALVTYVLSVIYGKEIISTSFPLESVGFIYFFKITNGLITISMFTVFLFLFTWEMKNNNATLEKRNHQLQQFANVDPLTRLPNRRSMMQTLNVAMHELSRGKTKFSIILGDIDNFKKINDNYGHDMGDKVLLTVAHTISAQLREGDAVCRWGGEEILILVKGNLESATAIAERIRLTISTTEVIHNNNSIRVSMTLGVTEAEIGYRIEQIIQSADNRMYYGKLHGKNQVVSKNH